MSCNPWARKESVTTERLNSTKPTTLKSLFPASQLPSWAVGGKLAGRTEQESREIVSQ